MTVAQKPAVVEQGELDEVLQSLFHERAEILAAQTGFIQRKRELSGSAFAKALVFGWLQNPEASYTQLRAMLSLLGCEMSQQALEHRMTAVAAEFLLALLTEAMGACIGGDGVLGELLHRFAGVYVQDGTVISLPAELKGVYAGCGSKSPEGGSSSLRVQCRLNLSDGAMKGWLQEGKACEREGAGSVQQAPLPANALYLVDSHYPTVQVMKQLSREQVSWITHLKADFVITDLRGVKYSVPEYIQKYGDEGEIDTWVSIGSKKEQQHWVRLVAFRVSEPVAQRRQQKLGQDSSTRAKGARRDVRVGKKHQRPSRDGRHRCKVGKKRAQLLGWSILITNVAHHRLSACEVRVLMRARWQIELLWKLWKERGQVDIWRSEKAMRILCEVYAKLLGLLVQHWLILRSCWQQPWRSIVKASQIVKMLSVSLVLTLTWGMLTLQDVLFLGGQAMQRAVIERSRQHCSTARMLADPSLANALN